MLTKAHNGIFGSHSNGILLAQKLLMVGYYCLTMQEYVMSYAKSCRKCLLHGNLIHSHGHKLIPSITHWLFQQWDFDLVGKIYPSSCSGHMVIITMIEYFTK